jgi:hypothetical protein
MTRKQFEETLAKLQAIGAGNGPRNSDIDKHLAKVDSATESLDQIATQLERPIASRELSSTRVLTGMTTGTTTHTTLTSTVQKDF